MALVRVIKVREGRAKIREELKNRLAQNGTEAEGLIGKLAADTTVVWRPAELDKIAKELRDLAFEIKYYQDAKLATEEA
jgi:hypothetical protein